VLLVRVVTKFHEENQQKHFLTAARVRRGAPQVLQTIAHPPKTPMVHSMFLPPTHSDFITIASSFLFIVSFLILLFLKTDRRRRKHSNPPRRSPSDDVATARSPEAMLRVAVYYGTQTGTSARLARELEEATLHRYGKQVYVRLIDLEQVTAERAEVIFTRRHEPLAIFLQSTYGDGEPTDSSLEFIHWLRDQADDGRLPELLKGLTFCVFGLGNSSYEQFNAAGKCVDHSLKSLGAARLMKLHLGDDDYDLEGDFRRWKEALWASIEDTYGIHADDGIDQVSVNPAYCVSTVSHEDALEAEKRTRDAMSKCPRDGFATQQSPFAASVILARELHNVTSTRSCVHVEFDISDSGITYQPGDHLGVFAENSLPVIQRAAACLRLPLDHSFSLSVPEGSPVSLPQPFSNPCTLATALAKYTDLLSPPRKGALEALASVSTDKVECERLKHLASTDGKNEYEAFIGSPKRSLLEVLESFPSAVPPLGLFFGAIGPRLSPRYYSISSSPRCKSNVVSATVAVVSTTTPTGRLHEGVASSYLAKFVSRTNETDVVNSAMKETRVPLFVRSSTFKLPRDPIVPIVMIGPGTGFAPFRGFLQEREALLRAGNTLGPAYLFFGCRHEDQDFIYRDEMEGALQNNVISVLQVAFSRSNSSHKVYVQDKLASVAKDLHGIMKGTIGANEGRIYVCGDAKRMARDVHRALHVILMNLGGDAAHEAEGIVKRLAESGRYQKDVW